MSSDDGLVKLAHYQMGFQARLLQMAMKSAAAAPAVEEFMEKQAMAALLGRALGRMGTWGVRPFLAGGRTLGGWGRGIARMAGDLRTGMDEGWASGMGRGGAPSGPFGPRTSRPFPGAGPAGRSGGAPSAAETIRNLRSHSQNMGAGGPRIRVEGAPNVPHGTPFEEPGAAAGGAGAAAGGAGFTWPGWVPESVQTAGNWLGAKARDNQAWAGGLGGGVAGYGTSSAFQGIGDWNKRRKLRNMGFMDRLMMAGNLAFSPESFTERYM